MCGDGSPCQKHPDPKVGVETLQVEVGPKRPVLVAVEASEGRWYRKLVRRTLAKVVCHGVLVQGVHQVCRSRG